MNGQKKWESSLPMANRIGTVHTFDKCSGCVPLLRGKVSLIFVDHRLFEDI